MVAQGQFDTAQALQEARRYFYEEHNYLAAAAILRRLLFRDPPPEGVTAEHYHILGHSYHQLTDFGRDEVADALREAAAEGFPLEDLKGVVAERSQWRAQADECLKRSDAGKGQG